MTRHNLENKIQIHLLLSLSFGRMIQNTSFLIGGYTFLGIFKTNELSSRKGYKIAGIADTFFISCLADEICRQLVDADAQFVVTTVDRFDALKEACALTKRSIRIATVRHKATEALPEGAIDFAELINPHGVDFSALRRPNVSIEDIAFLPYSSGTTGLPKGVQLTHRNITSNCEMLKAKSGDVCIVEPTTDNFQDVLPCVLPFFHIYGLTVTLLSKMQFGCKIVTLPRFHPDSFLNVMAKHRGTVLHLVPPISKFCL